MSNYKKVYQLHGPYSTKTLLANLLENAEDISDIALVVKLKTDETAVYHTVMELGIAAWLDAVFRNDFLPVMMNEE